MMIKIIYALNNACIISHLHRHSLQGISVEKAQNTDFIWWQRCCVKNYEESDICFCLLMEKFTIYPGSWLHEMFPDKIWIKCHVHVNSLIQPTDPKLKYCIW